MSAPCSVNAKGADAENRSPRRWMQFATTSAFSAPVSSSMKSPGNPPGLRRTC